MSHVVFPGITSGIAVSLSFSPMLVEQASRLFQTVAPSPDP
jgi:hypothetical protein